MKAKKDGKIKNDEEWKIKNMIPDSGGVVPGIGHPDSGRCWTSAFSKCIQ